MAENYKVRLEKDYFVFSSGHFITFNGNICERLHGHNYRVAAEVEGPLDENHYVIDFIAFRDVLKGICDELDHHMLLPTKHPLIKVIENKADDCIEVTFEERRWVFPTCDCILLDMPNTTSELMARHIGRKLLDQLEKRTGIRPQVLRVEVDETFGQIAACEFIDE